MLNYYFLLATLTTTFAMQCILASSSNFFQKRDCHSDNLQHLLNSFAFRTYLNLALIVVCTLYGIWIQKVSSSSLPQIYHRFIHFLLITILIYVSLSAYDLSVPIQPLLQDLWKCPIPFDEASANIEICQTIALASFTASFLNFSLHFPECQSKQRSEIPDRANFVSRFSNRYSTQSQLFLRGRSTNPLKYKYFSFSFPQQKQ